MGHFKHIVLACEELKKRQARLELSEHKLIQDCDTFHLLHIILKRLVEMWRPVSAVFSVNELQRDRIDTLI